MTQHQKLLADVLQKQLEGLSLEQITEKLLSTGLANVRTCEHYALYDEITRLVDEGMPRCEAMQVAADKFCCSYEKARDSFYNLIKQKTS